MNFTSMADFSKPDGSLDWAAYHEAQKNNGERCSACSQATSAFDWGKGMVRCADCRQAEGTGELTHACRIRCPHCRAVEAPEELGNQLYEEGEQAVSCPACGKDFEVGVRIHYSYVSPAPVQEGVEDGDEEESEDDDD